MAPLRKKVKMGKAPEEITFDPSEREEFLKGFRKRKQARLKHGQEVAAKKEREERIQERAKLREQRKEDLANHVKQVNDTMRQMNKAAGLEDKEDEMMEESGSENEEWNGIEEEKPPVVDINHEDEYIDEDKYTTVTIGEVDITRDGMAEIKAAESASEEEGDDQEQGEDGVAEVQSEVTNGDSIFGKKKRVWTKEKPPKDPNKRPKKKKRDFRYESKGERKMERAKAKQKRIKAARKRRGEANP